MHEWHTLRSTNIQKLIGDLEDFDFTTDYGGPDKVTRVKVTNRMFNSEEDTIQYVTSASYGGRTAYIAAFTTNKVTKAFTDAFNNFLLKREEYEKFDRDLSIAYGRKSSKVTCPNCESSINLSYGRHFKSCPICGSRKIISDSNWKILETKRNLVSKASEQLSVVAEKCKVTFVGGIEWHC